MWKQTLQMCALSYAQKFEAVERLFQYVRVQEDPQIVEEYTNFETTPGEVWKKTQKVGMTKSQMEN